MQFSGFESVENHTEFAKTEGIVKYREIVRFASGFEVKHPRAAEGLYTGSVSSQMRQLSCLGGKTILKSV